MIKHAWIRKIMKCDLKKEITLPQWRILLGCLTLTLFGFLVGKFVN